VGADGRTQGEERRREDKDSGPGKCEDLDEEKNAEDEKWVVGEETVFLGGQYKFLLCPNTNQS